MPKPAVPVPGALVATDWGKQITDYAGEKWRFVSAAQTALLSSFVPPAADTVYDLECTKVPANDPDVVAAAISCMIRDTSGKAIYLRVSHGTNNGVAGHAWTTGIAANKGPGSGNHVVLLGGVNNRSIKWQVGGNVDVSTALIWIWYYGYYVRETVTASELRNRLISTDSEGAADA